MPLTKVTINYRNRALLLLIRGYCSVTMQTLFAHGDTAACGALAVRQMNFRRRLLRRWGLNQPHRIIDGAEGGREAIVIRPVFT